MPELKPKIRTPEDGHWFYIPNCLFDDFKYFPKHKPYLIAVYACLVRYANTENRSWPSQARIANETGMSIRMVKMILKNLKARRLINTKRIWLFKKTRNLYYLTHESEWVMESAQYALGLVHSVHPKKTYIKKKEIKELRINLAKKMRAP